MQTIINCCRLPVAELAAAAAEAAPLAADAAAAAAAEALCSSFRLWCVELWSQKAPTQFNSSASVEELAFPRFVTLGSGRHLVRSKVIMLRLP